jgi:hypothetical protein
MYSQAGQRQGRKIEPKFVQARRHSASSLLRLPIVSFITQAVTAKVAADAMQMHDDSGAGQHEE